MFWIYNFFSNNLQIDIIKLDFFRIIFSFTLLLKFTVESYRGYFNIFKRHTYLYATYQAPLKGKGLLKEEIWKLLYIAKILAAICLLKGIYINISLLIIILWMVVELKIYFKYHTNYMMLIAISLLFSNSAYPNLPFFLISFNSSCMYLSTAFKKMNESFLSGRLITQTLLITKKSKRFFYDNFIPNSLFKLIVSDEKPTKLLSGLMYATVIIEIIIPFGLSIPKLWTCFAVIGFFMHLGFTILFPVTLLHFSILTLASYLTFIP